MRAGARNAPRRRRQLGVATLRDATPAMVEAANGTLDSVVARRARHVTTENLRTVAAAAHLEAGEFAEVGALMYAQPPIAA